MLGLAQKFPSLCPSLRQNVVDSRSKSLLSSASFHFWVRHVSVLYTIFAPLHLFADLSQTPCTDQAFKDPDDEIIIEKKKMPAYSAVRVVIHSYRVFNRPMNKE